MTTVGKILVVLHLVLSVMFMAFAGAVYTAQTNWKEATKKAKDELARSKTTIGNITAERDKDLADAADKIARLTTENQKLSGQGTALSTQVAALDSENRQLRKEVDQQRDFAALTTTEAIERKKEADLQRDVNSQLFASRETLVKNRNETEDKRFSLDVQLQQVSDKYEQLLNDYKITKSFLASKKLTTDPKEMIVQTAPPPPVDGLITEVRKSDKSSQELVEISIGSDDGLVNGHKMTISNGSKYIGVVRLTMVQADKSVGTVVERAKNMTVHAGDKVSTKF